MSSKSLKSFGLYTLFGALGAAFTWVTTNMHVIVGSDYSSLSQVILAALTAIGVGAYIEKGKKQNEVIQEDPNSK